MSRKAIAYVSDIILGRTGEVVSRKEQRAAIEQHAKENNIEVVAWFEDGVYASDLFSRRGIQALLECEEACDCLLVERTQSLSGKWPELRRLLDKLAERSIVLEAATLRWDCVSQMARHYPKRLGENRPARLNPLVAPGPAYGVAPRPALIARPRTLYFTGLRGGSKA